MTQREPLVRQGATELDRVRAERDRYRDEYRAFVEGLTQALNEHGVPAMPSWREAIDWLAANGAHRREGPDAA